MIWYTYCSAFGEALSYGILELGRPTTDGRAHELVSASMFGNTVGRNQYDLEVVLSRDVVQIFD